MSSPPQSPHARRGGWLLIGTGVFFLVAGIGVATTPIEGDAAGFEAGYGTMLAVSGVALAVLGGFVRRGQR